MIFRAPIFSLLLLLNAPAVEITIHPEQIRSINGVSKLERERYFALATNARFMERNLRSPERLQAVIGNMEVNLGRVLGPINDITKYSDGFIREDPARPGFVDLTLLREKLAQSRKEPSEALKKAFGSNFHTAAHGQKDPFPDFMGKYSTEDSLKNHHKYLPKNIAAAAELSAEIFKHAYTDFDRPRFYEPVNEPHWSFYGDVHLANWHLETKKAVKELTPEVQVGGLCISVGYFYNNYFRAFGGLRQFMDNTKGEMDFYSFHAYDYFHQAEAGKNRSRVTSGLPLEGVLDLVNAHAMNSLGREIDIVVSEHGGYCLQGDKPASAYDGEWLATKVLEEKKITLSESFEDELKRRSIPQFLHLSSIIANTLAFMDHPHSVQKAVPFILDNTENWDTKYYASLFTPEDYQQGGDLKENYLGNFYRLFQGVSGERIIVDSPDPDLQVRSFRNGTSVSTIINNLSTKEHTLNLKGLESASHEIRRLYRDENFLPHYQVQQISKTDAIILKGRETICLTSTLTKEPSSSSTTHEKIFYGDLITQVVDPEATLELKIKVPNASRARSAVLRLSLDRGVGSDYRVNVSLNGIALTVPLEDSAIRYDDENGGYATTKFITIPSPKTGDLLKEENTLTISFPDGKKGAIGAAVIRARFSDEPDH